MGLLITTLTVSTMVSAYQGDPNVQSPNYDPIRHEAMIEAIDNKDYDTWAELHNGRGRLSEVITVDNFDQFIAMHELMLAGDKDAAEEIREDLGLGIGRGQGNGNKDFARGFHRGYQKGSGDFLNQ